MTAAEMARLHAAAFAGAEVWTEAALAALLGTAGTQAIALPGIPGFALIRVLPPEAELLTLAVAPEAQGRGHGRRLLHAGCAAARAAGAESLFLEVDAANAAARALYSGAGFAQIGRRAGYYRHPDGTRSDALVLRAMLAALE